MHQGVSIALPSESPTSPQAVTVALSLAGTGIAGLDEVLRGGLPRKRLYLVQGDPGVGKTTLRSSFFLKVQRAGSGVCTSRWLRRSRKSAR